MRLRVEFDVPALEVVDGLDPRLAVDHVLRDFMARAKVGQSVHEAMISVPDETIPYRVYVDYESAEWVKPEKSSMAVVVNVQNAITDQEAGFSAGYRRGLEDGRSGRGR